MAEAPEGHRQLQQRQRVAPGVVEDAATDPASQLGEVLVQQGLGRRIGQWGDGQSRQVDVVEEARLPGACRAQEADGAAGQPAGDEGQYPGAGLVQPRQVVDDQQHRLVLGCCPEQRQGGGGDQGGVAGVGSAQLDGGAERLPVGRVELRHQTEERPQQLVEGGEADLDLELRTCRAHHVQSQVVGVCGGRLEQRRLADTGFSGDQQRAAAGIDTAEEPPQGIQLVIASDQALPGTARRATCGVRSDVGVRPRGRRRVLPLRLPMRHQPSRRTRDGPRLRHARGYGTLSLERGRPAAGGSLAALGAATLRRQRSFLDGDSVGIPGGVVAAPALR